MRASSLLLSLTALTALAACSKPQPRDREEPASEMSPDISPTNAPGVAFNYRYAFRLAAGKIGETQERHAQACEKLGIDRCRITGMRFRLIDGHDIEAMLAFKLEPTLARQFGKEGIAAVTQAEGMLIDSEISGENVGSQIGAAQKAEARLRDERARIETKLAQKGLPAAERARLDEQLAELARDTEASKAGRDEKAESLATTPMVFTYGSGEILPGFDARSPIRNALGTAADTMMGVIAFLIVLLGAVIPVAVLGGVIWLVWRPLRAFAGRLRPKPAETVAPGGTP